MVKFVLLVIVFFLTAFSGCKKSETLQTQASHRDIHSILQTIPDQDRAILDSFFQFLLGDNCFSYTLFGNKPMSVSDYFSEINVYTLYHPAEFLTFEKGWELWEHYASYFPSNDFILKRRKGSRGTFSIFLVNKKHTLEVISNNLTIFQNVLGEEIDPQQLLQKICYSDQDIIEEALNNDGTLLGILLGYGKVNSVNFELKTNICNRINAKMTPPFSAEDEMKSLPPTTRHLVKLLDNENARSYGAKNCFDSSQEGSLAEQLNDLLSHHEPFELYGSDFFLDKMRSPAFMARKESPETEKLHEDYLATKEKIHEAYLERSFLEVTLNQWSHPQ